MPSLHGRAALAGIAVCVLAGIGMPHAARATGIDFTDLEYSSRPFSYPTNPTPMQDAPAGTSFNYQTIFNSLPTGVAGYGTTALSSILDTSNQSLIPGGSIINKAEQYTARFTTALPGDYLFRAGGDEGYGATLNVDGQILAERWPTSQGSTDADMWWAGSWVNPSQHLQGEASLPAGQHTLVWTGFDSCCDGAAELDYSTDRGETWLPLTVTADVPEPSSWLIFGGGCAMLGLCRALLSRRHPAA